MQFASVATAGARLIYLFKMETKNNRLYQLKSEQFHTSDLLVHSERYKKPFLQLAVSDDSGRIWKGQSIIGILRSGRIAATDNLL